MANIRRVAKKFGKDVMIVETGYSYEYEMIRAYYFGRDNEKITLMQLAGEYGVSAMSITRTLRRGSRYLRNYIIRHEKTG